MSNQYFQDIFYQNDQYNNTVSYNNNPLNPIYKEPIKRDTIYEDVKVNKPIVLSPGDNSYFQNVNYNNNNNDNLYSEYQTSNYNDVNSNNYFTQTTTEFNNNNENLYSEYKVSNYNDTNNNNYFTQTTNEINNNNDNIYSEYQTSNYNDVNSNNYFTQTTTEFKNNDNLYPQYQISNNNIDIDNNKYFNQTTTEIISENNLGNYYNGTYENKVIDLNNNENFSNTYSYSNNHNPPMIIKNQIKNIEYQTVQNIGPKKIEFAQIKKLTDNKDINKFNNIPQNINNFIKTEKQIKNEPIKEKAIVQRIKEDNDENINKIKEESKPKISQNIKNLPGPAKISKISNGYIPLNPRVRFAKEEKKINIVKLNDDNDKNNNIINNNIINNINNKDKTEKIPEVKKEEEIIKIGLKNENLIDKENNMNNNNIILNNELKKEKKREGKSPKEPNDDYNSKKLDNKFHKVRILKKSPSDELFPHTNLLDLGDYEYFSDENKNKNQKANIIYLNDNKNKEGKNQFIAVKKIIPKNIHEKQNELFKKSQDNIKDNINSNEIYLKKQYENIKDNNKKEENSNDNEDIVESHEDFEFNDDEVKDSDEIYNKKRIKEDSNIKKNINNDGLDEFDNNFNEHDKFYKKMKNLLDEELN